jgi:hypothetical protein
MMDDGSPLKFVSPSGFEEAFRLSVDKVSRIKAENLPSFQKMIVVHVEAA